MAWPAWSCSLGRPVIERAIDRRLMVAVEKGDRTAVLRALGEGANINFRSEPWGMTPLGAAARGEPRLISLLLAHGAVPGLADAEGMTPLMEAVYAGHRRGVARLLRAHAPVDSVGPRGRTAVFFAILFGRPDLVARLISAGANLNVADADGETPLSLATGEAHAARTMSVAEAAAMAPMAMPMHDEGMVMRTRQDENRRTAQVLTLVKAGGARLGRQKPRPVSVTDPCTLDEQWRPGPRR